MKNAKVTGAGYFVPRPFPRVCTLRAACSPGWNGMSIAYAEIVVETGMNELLPPSIEERACACGHVFGHL